MLNQGVNILQSKTKDHLLGFVRCFITVIFVLPPPVVPTTKYSHSLLLLKTGCITLSRIFPFSSQSCFIVKKNKSKLSDFKFSLKMKNSCTPNEHTMSSFALVY